MKKYLLLIILLAAVGCEDLEENAPTNYKKGEEFFKKGEYEVAEYYFDKIPEESPLYKRAQKRLLEVHKLQEIQATQAASPMTKQNVSIVRQSFQINNLGKVPIHFITLENATTQAVQLVEVEFTYLDAGNREVARLSTMLNVDIPPNSTRDIENISPGLVNEKFNSVSVKILRVLFK